jgi:hypothetical protein
VQRGRVHGRVHAGRDPVLGQYAAELQRERAVGERERVFRVDSDLRGRIVRGAALLRAELRRDERLRHDSEPSRLRVWCGVHHRSLVQCG